jgi:hypothetical protein
MTKRRNPTRGGSYIRRDDGSLHRLSPDEEEAIKTPSRKSFSEAVNTTLAQAEFSASAVFDRIKEALGCDSDAELAWVLGTSPQNVSHKRTRNSVPYREAIFVSVSASVSLDYLLTGRGALRP